MFICPVILPIIGGRVEVGLGVGIESDIGVGGGVEMRSAMRVGASVGVRDWAMLTAGGASTGVSMGIAGGRAVKAGVLGIKAAASPVEGSGEVIAASEIELRFTTQRKRGHSNRMSAKVSKAK